MFGRKRNTAMTTTAHGTPATTTPTTTHPTRHRISPILATLFALYFLFGAIELGLMADIVHYFHSKFEPLVPNWIERRAAYALWTAAWTVIASIIYFLLAKLWRKFNWRHILGLTILTFLFWITAAPLLEKAFTDIPYRQCAFVFGASKCKELKAARAFAWLLMVLSLLSIPLAWFFGRRAERDHHHNATTAGTTPVTREAHTGNHGVTTGTTGTTGVHPTTSAV